MTKDESKVIIDHLRERVKYEEGDGRDWDINFSYELDREGRTVDVTWWEDGGEEEICTKTYRIDIKMVATRKESQG